MEMGQILSISALPVGSGEDAFVSKLGDLFFWLSAHFRAPEIMRLMVLPVCKIKPKLFTSTGKL